MIPKERWEIIDEKFLKC